MAYDNKTNTTIVGNESDFMADSGVFFINTLKTTAEDKNAPSSLINDWKVVEEWLNCTGRQIINDDNEKIGKAWRAYLAVGVAPSDKLQPVFTSFSNQYQREGLEYAADKPPTEVMNVFDRLLATEEEIKNKQMRDIDNERKKFESILQNNNKKRKIHSRIKTLTKNKRIFISIIAAWTAWVTLRTTDSYEILGIYLDEWDDDMFFVNLVLPPLVVWISYSLYKWINRAEK